MLYVIVLLVGLLLLLATRDAFDLIILLVLLIFGLFAAALNVLCRRLRARLVSLTRFLANFTVCLWLRVLVCVFIDLIVVFVVCCCDLLLLWLMLLLLWLTFVKVQKVLHIKKRILFVCLCCCCLFFFCCFLFRLARTSRLTQSTTTDKVLLQAF